MGTILPLSHSLAGKGYGEVEIPTPFGFCGRSPLPKNCGVFYNPYESYHLWDWGLYWDRPIDSQLSVRTRRRPGWC